MTVLLACLANAVLGALWRRAFGGWLGARRWLTIPLGCLLGWPIFVAWPTLWGLAMACLPMLFFLPGHNLPDHWFRRYGPFGFGYWFAGHSFTEKEWARRGWPMEGFIDGWMATGELFLGATFWGVLPLVLLIGG